MDDVSERATFSPKIGCKTDCCTAACEAIQQKTTQKRRNELIFQSFVFQGNFVLHGKPTGLRLEDISIKMLITGKLKCGILSDCCAAVRAHKRGNIKGNKSHAASVT